MRNFCFWFKIGFLANIQPEWLLTYRKDKTNMNQIWIRRPFHKLPYVGPSNELFKKTLVLLYFFYFRQFFCTFSCTVLENTKKGKIAPAVFYNLLKGKKSQLPFIGPKDANFKILKFYFFIDKQIPWFFSFLTNWGLKYYI